MWFSRLATTLLVLAVMCALPSCGGNGVLPPGQDHSVAAVDLKRYMGMWYEIASLPAPFQEDCHCTTARYTLKGDYVEVINTCRRESAQGELDTAEGKAWPVEGSNNSRLKVSFFWPFKGDYWVIGLDPDYRWAMVGHPDKKYLWILSRTPRLAPEVYAGIEVRARELGYEVDKLQLMDQSCHQVGADSRIKEGGLEQGQ